MVGHELQTESKLDPPAGVRYVGRSKMYIPALDSTGCLSVGELENLPPGVWLYLESKGIAPKVKHDVVFAVTTDEKRSTNGFFIRGMYFVRGDYMLEVTPHGVIPPQPQGQDWRIVPQEAAEVLQQGVDRGERTAVHIADKQGRLSLRVI